MDGQILIVEELSLDNNAIGQASFLTTKSSKKDKKILKNQNHELSS